MDKLPDGAYEFPYSQILSIPGFSDARHSPVGAFIGVHDVVKELPVKDEMICNLALLMSQGKTIMIAATTQDDLMASVNYFVKMLMFARCEPAGYA